MGILDILNAVAMEGYNAKEDVKGGFENLKDGVYSGYVSDFYFKSNDKGTEWFGFEITLPEENNQKYWANLFLSGKMAEVNFKRMLHYVYNMSGVTMDATEFADTELGTETAKNHVLGAQVNIELTTNAKDFQTFKMDVTAMAQGEEEQVEEATEDEDMPF